MKQFLIMALLIIALPTFVFSQSRDAIRANRNCYATKQYVLTHGFDSTHCWTELFTKKVTACSNLTLTSPDTIKNNGNVFTIGDYLSDMNGNCRFGTNAGISITSGAYNISIGVGSGYSNTTGQFNTFIGGWSGASNIDGNNNTIIGYGSFGSNTSGYGNTTNGAYTLMNNINGYLNTAIGMQSMEYNTSGINNTANGAYSLRNNNGSNNSAFGFSTLMNNTTGSYNTAVGFEALLNNNVGQFNTAIGLWSLNSNVSGGNNVAIGGSALYNNDGSGNTAIGLGALFNNTLGNNNTAIGASASYSSIIGENNTTIGWGALEFNTIGSHNTAIGFVSIGSNVIGNYNTSIGDQSLFLNTIGSNNTVIGYQAGHDNIGSGNIFIGYQSGYWETGSNKLYISNSDADSTNALIFGNFATKKLAVNGTVHIGSNKIDTAGVFFTSPNVFYVNKNRIDAYVENGSFTRPYKTIMAAVNRIIINGDNSQTNPYTIRIAPAVYVENIVLEDAKLVSLIIIGEGSRLQTQINPSSGYSLQSMANNSNFYDLHIENIQFIKPTIMVGSTNGTFFGYNFFFDNCYWPSTALATFRNMVYPSFLGNITKFSGGVIFSNITSASINNIGGFKSSAFTIETDENANKPNSFSGGTKVAVSNCISVNVTWSLLNIVTLTGTTLQIRNVRYGSSGETIPVNAAILAYNSSLIGSYVNNGTLTLYNSHISGALTGTGSNNFYQYDKYLANSSSVSGTTIKDALDTLDLHKIDFTDSAGIFITPHDTTGKWLSYKKGVFNNITTDTVNSLRMIGSTTIWNDLFFPFTTGNSGGGLYPPLVLDSMYYNFVIDSTGGTKCFEYFIIQLPHYWKAGSYIYPHVHFKYETGKGTPTFLMKYKWYELGGTMDMGWQWIKMGTVSATTDKTHQYVTFTTGINGSGKSISSILICEIYLLSTTGVTKQCNAYQFDIHIEQDALGSNTEWVK